MFGDVNYGDRVRVFGEFIWADSFAEDLPAALIDVNRGDLLNLFVDLRLFDLADHGVYVRGGRQELLLGSQRLDLDPRLGQRSPDVSGREGVSPGREMGLRRVLGAAGAGQRPSEFDSPDENANFAGNLVDLSPRKGPVPGFLLPVLWQFQRHHPAGHHPLSGRHPHPGHAVDRGQRRLPVGHRTHAATGPATTAGSPGGGGHGWDSADTGKTSATRRPPGSTTTMRAATRTRTTATSTRSTSSIPSGTTTWAGSIWSAARTSMT